MRIKIIQRVWTKIVHHVQSLLGITHKSKRASMRFVKYDETLICGWNTYQLFCESEY